MKNKNWFWGLFFLLSSIFIIASQIWSFENIGIMSLLATFFLSVLIISSLINRNYFGIFIPLSVLYMIYYKPLALVYISPWLLILSAVLISISFSLLFRRYSGKFHSSLFGDKHLGQFVDNSSENNPHSRVVVSSATKYLHSESLEGGRFISHLGVLEVYFDQAQPVSGGAKLYINCNMGVINLYIPRHWNVVDNIHLYAGEVKHGPKDKAITENAPQLILTGNAIMGNVNIYYV